MNMHIKSLIMCLLLILPTACVTKVSVPTPNILPKIENFPQSPNIQKYTRKPIIDSVDNNFIVSDEFLKNSIILQKYNERVSAWKKLYNVN